MYNRELDVYVYLFTTTATNNTSKDTMQPQSIMMITWL